VRLVAGVAVGAVLLAGCGSSGGDTDATLRDTVRDGAAAMRTERAKALEQKLEATLASLRKDKPSTEADRRARALAIHGFTWALVSARAEIEFQYNDNGRLAEATKDARRADTARRESERLLRAAARELQIDLGSLDRL
jgi:hypothetical protein